MNTAPRTLEALFDQVRALDEQQQAWIAERLEEQLAEAKGESNTRTRLRTLIIGPTLRTPWRRRKQD